MSLVIDDAKERARLAWGASPTGWTSAEGQSPGTKAFFERAFAFRSEVEQPWLPEVVPFHTMRGKRVLELGFGPGYDAFTFMQNGALYTGIDITPENVVRTQQHLSFYGLTPEVSEGDAEALTFPDASFDVVYSNGVLHHTPDIAKAFREARRVLQPGGEFFVIVYHRNSIVARVSTVLRALLSGRSIRDRFAQMEANTAGISPLVNVYSRQELATLLNEAGFTVANISVRKMQPDDMPLPRIFLPLYRLVPQRFYDAVGRRWGWYVVGRGVKPRAMQ